MSAMYRESLWLFPVTQALHLVALALFVGAVLMVDLRLLGWGFTSYSRAQVARDARPWLVGGFAGLVITGIPQFTTAAVRYYDSPVFAIKMGILLVALIYTFTVRRSVAMADDGRVGPFRAGAAGAASILLWTAVTVSGRAIGFY